MTSAPVIDQQEITSNDYYTLSETGEKIFIFEQENFPLPVDPPAPPPSIKNVNLRNLQNTTKEEVPLVTSDEYYVLTKNFYLNDTEKMSVFEGLVISYIKKEPVDKANLLNICKLFPKWSLLQQFYYLPIVLVMIKSIIRGD